MVDWNEDELADIILGDANERYDRIVPYPKESIESTLYAYEGLSKKQTSQEAKTVVKSAEHDASEDKNDPLGCKLEDNSCFNVNEELSARKLDMDPWPADIGNQDSIGHADPGLFGNVDEDKESGSFLDYSWASIGNFDELDNIFRNNDSILGNEIIDHADELWSSSANFVAASSPDTDKIARRSTADQYNMEREFKPYESQCVVPVCNKIIEVAGLKSKPLEKVNRERKQLNYQKKEGKSKAKALHNLYGAWSPTSSQNQRSGNVKMHSSTSSVPHLSPQRLHGGPESFRYLHTFNTFMNTAYGYPANNFPVMPMPPLNLSVCDQSKPVMAGYNCAQISPKPAYLPKKLLDAPSRQSAMTPLEKIEKLRRHQQIQAMLAIQQQKQQLKHQVTCIDHSQDDQQHDLLESNVEIDEDVLKLPSHELNVPTVQEDSSIVSTLSDECTLEETILNQLQGVIGKLDANTRLSIQDSLFRLAKSAIQRRTVCDVSSANKRSKDEDEVFGCEEMSSNNRSTHFEDLETDCNHIDRTVAHLLFHRPTTTTCRRLSKDGFLESPFSGNPEDLPVLQETEDCLSPPTKCLSDY